MSQAMKHNPAAAFVETVNWNILLIANLLWVKCSQTFCLMAPLVIYIKIWRHLRCQIGLKNNNCDNWRHPGWEPLVYGHELFLHVKVIVYPALYEIIFQRVWIQVLTRTQVEFWCCIEANWSLYIYKTLRLLRSLIIIAFFRLPDDTLFRPNMANCRFLKTFFCITIDNQRVSSH